MGHNTLNIDYSYFMQKALKEAYKAFEADEVPIGAIIVDSHGTILSKAHNKVEKKHSQVYHAELQALKKAGKKIGDWRLEGCSIYVTLEPCAMCMNAIYLSRINTVIYGTSSPLFGFETIDKQGLTWLYKKDAPTIISHIEQEESKRLLQKFFKQKRNKS